MSSEATAAVGVDLTMMRAVVQDRYGASEVLWLSEVARPKLSEQDVLVRVAAAGLDRARST